MKIEELLKDEEFGKKVEKAESLEEVAKLFSDQGIEITVEELEKAIDADESGELDEENLENIAGGVIGLRAAAYIVSAIKASKCIYRGPRKR